MNTAALLTSLVILGVLVWAVFAFNRLVRLRNQVRTAWADIDVQLSRRHDLIPALVAAVKAYAGHERNVLETVTALRTQALGLRNPKSLGAVESELEHAIGRLIVLQEAYPDLKANANFAQLQRDLVKVEDVLQFARRFYNGAVRDFNNAIQRVPDVLVARVFGFNEAEFYQAGDDARPVVSIDMS